MDDKLTVIICATLIALVSMWMLGEPETVVTAVVSGLFGVAIGKELK